MMRKIILWIIGIVIFLVAGFFALNSFIYNEKQAVVVPGYEAIGENGAEGQATVTGASYKDAEYIIDGQRVKLTNGVSEVVAAPGSASKIVTRYFGNEVRHDLNGDKREDVVFLLTQQTGGSGTFYYVVAALNLENGYVGSQALLLGDRIAPQTTEMSRDPARSNVVIVNYADRAPGESFAVSPSVGKSIWLLLDPKTVQFGEVAQNFEGEAEPARMTLTMKTWTWVSSLFNDGAQITPHDTNAFSITFSNDGTFSSTTDCNRVSGKYEAGAGKISMSAMLATKMYCENSEQDLFVRMLGDAEGYHFTSKGELVFDLKFDSGSVIFK